MNLEETKKQIRELLEQLDIEELISLQKEIDKILDMKVLFPQKTGKSEFDKK